jgi:phage terminase large subunit GpA-like protein
MGDPALSEPWQRLETLLTAPYEHENGAQLRIQCTCIDSGFHTDAVYKFVRPRQGRKTYATKGIAGRPKPLVGKLSRANRAGVRVFPIGVDPAKDNLFNRLKIQMPGPGYMHFPRQIPDEFMDQFGAEKAITQYVKGVSRRVYKLLPGRRNEAIDLEVLNMAALEILGAGVTEHLERWVEKVKTEGEETKRRVAGEGRPREKPRSSWMTRWRYE